MVEKNSLGINAINKASIEEVITIGTTNQNNSSYKQSDSSGPDPEGVLARGGQTLGGADPQWQPIEGRGFQEQSPGGSPRHSPWKLLNFKH